MSSGPSAPLATPGGASHTDFWNRKASRLASRACHAHAAAMRTISRDVSVRLYHLSDADGGAASTLLYGTLADALEVAAAQPDAVQAGLFIQTSNDVISYLDYVEG